MRLTTDDFRQMSTIPTQERMQHLLVLAQESSPVPLDRQRFLHALEASEQALGKVIPLHGNGGNPQDGTPVRQARATKPDIVLLPIIGANKWENSAGIFITTRGVVLVPDLEQKNKGTYFFFERHGLMSAFRWQTRADGGDIRVYARSPMASKYMRIHMSPALVEDTIANYNLVREYLPQTPALVPLSICPCTGAKKVWHRRCDEYLDLLTTVSRQSPPQQLIDACFEQGFIQCDASHRAQVMAVLSQPQFAPDESVLLYLYGKHPFAPHKNHIPPAQENGIIITSAALYYCALLPDGRYTCTRYPHTAIRSFDLHLHPDENAYRLYMELYTNPDTESGGNGSIFELSVPTSQEQMLHTLIPYYEYINATLPTIYPLPPAIEGELHNPTWYA